MALQHRQDKHQSREGTEGADHLGVKPSRVPLFTGIMHDLKVVAIETEHRDCENELEEPEDGVGDECWERGRGLEDGHFVDV